MENLENEIWKDVVGYEGYYMVSNIGRVRSLDRSIYLPSKGTYKKLNGRILRFYKSKFGYYCIVLQKEKNLRRARVHRLVAESFIENKCKNHTIVNHINKNRKDNKIENLEWCSQRENVTHGERSKNKTSKYTGVRWVTRDSKWRASIFINNKYINLGTHFNEEEARDSYQKALKEYHIINKYSTT